MIWASNAKETKSSFTKGQSSIRPPLFYGENYDYQRERMRMFSEGSHIDIWEEIKVGNNVPCNNAGNDIPHAQ